MHVIGLTGGIGMGKSTVAKMFGKCGIPAFNADEAVHALQARNGKAIPAIANAFAGTVRDGVLDRTALRKIVLADPLALRRLETIMHPLVRGAEKDFRAAAMRQGRHAILLDIPLLFESGTGRRGTGRRGTGRRGTGRRYASQMLATLTVSCPPDVQLRRVMARGSMSLEQIATLIAKQMPDKQKRRLADYVIPTGLSKFHTLKTVRRLVEVLLP